MTQPVSYESLWHFWLDDACYQVARGVRYLALPGEVGADTWERVEPELPRLQELHGVLIRGIDVGDGVYELQVAAAPWVFALLDHATEYMAQSTMEHAVVGALLGYGARQVQDFCDELVKP